MADSSPSSLAALLADKLSAAGALAPLAARRWSGADPSSAASNADRKTGCHGVITPRRRSLGVRVSEIARRTGVPHESILRDHALSYMLAGIAATPALAERVVFREQLRWLS